MQPKNGYYLTSEDFPNFQDSMGDELMAYDTLHGIERVDNSKHSSKEKDGTPNVKLRTQNITFVVTESCNLNCTYCYETHKTGKVMTKEIAKEAVDMILDKERVNGYYDPEYSSSVILEFIGGEPLLNIEVIDYAVEYFKKRTLELHHPWNQNYMISMSSNGTLYFDEKVQDFLRRNEGRVDLGITIDGNKELHDKCRLFYDGRGSYDIVEKAVKDWNSKHDKTTTKVTLAPENIDYLVDAIENLTGIGIQCAYTNCCFEKGWNIEHAKVMYKRMKELADYLLDDNYTEFYCSLFDESIGVALTETRNWCGGNGDMLAIGTDGQCFSCIRFMGYSLNGREEKPIGNIWDGLDSPEKNCWLCALQKIDMITQCQHDDNRKCLTCPISQGCALCTGYNYDYYGDPDHKATFICDMHRARVLANVYYWNKLYAKLGLNKSFSLNLDKETALKIINEEEYNRLLDLVKTLEGE